MANIPLTQGLVAIVDEEDASRVLAHTWHAIRSNRTTYAATTIDGQRVYLHQFIVAGAVRVDHRDRDGLNNQRFNLRPCTHQQNLFNRPPQTNNTSGYKGVSFDRSRGKWLAFIVLDGRQRHLGRFASPLEAAAAYDQAASQLFGEFAFLNLGGAHAHAA